MDRRLVSRHDVIVLVKLGALGFTGLSRSQLAAAEQYYASLAETGTLRRWRPGRTWAPWKRTSGRACSASCQAAEWSPETIAAYELAHLGFYTASPLEVERHAARLGMRRPVSASCVRRPAGSLSSSAQRWQSVTYKMPDGM